MRLGLGGNEELYLTRETLRVLPSTTALSHAQGTLRSADGLELFEQSWSCEDPIGLIVLVHGFGEHSSRHAEAACFFSDAGFAVQAFDLRGHGRSRGRRCFVSSFDRYLDDTEAVLTSAARTWPGVPVFMLAHSLGGLVAALFAADGRAHLDGLLLSAPAVKLGSDYSRFKIAASLALGRVAPHLPMVRFKSTSISSDQAVVRDYREDRLVFHGRTPARTASEIIRAIRRLGSVSGHIGVPLLVLHGGLDQVADVEGSRELFRRVGSVDKTMRIHEGLWHEIMHEPDRMSVLGEILGWLEERTPGLVVHRSGPLPAE